MLNGFLKVRYLQVAAAAAAGVTFHVGGYEASHLPATS